MKGKGKIKVPLTGDVPFGCVACGRLIRPDPQSLGTRADKGAWRGAVVGVLRGGFLSRHDGQSLLLGLCDNCVDEALATGRVVRCSPEGDPT